LDGKYCFPFCFWSLDTFFVLFVQSVLVSFFYHISVTFHIGYTCSFLSNENDLGIYTSMTLNNKNELENNHPLLSRKKIQRIR
jgi:hypothetical protein